MNAKQRNCIADVASRTSEALDQLRLIEARQALFGRPRLVRDGSRSVDYEADHWRERIVWQAVGLWLEDPALMVPTIRAVIELRPEQSRWRLHKLCQLWAQVGGPDRPVLGPTSVASLVA
jgi:hypothetical protein